MHTLSKHEGIRFYCDQCEYKVTQKGILRVQNNRNMKTSYKQTLRIHNQSKHRDIKFDCDQCEYKAKTKRNLRVHTLSKHTTQRNTKELSESAKKINLKVHKESKHVDIKSNCDQCENKATQKCHLSEHKQSKN